MTGDVSQTWFQNILPKLEPRNVIVMDNALYHSVRLSYHPSTSWRKQEIIDWLRSYNVTFDECNVKAELLKIAQNVADNNENKYVIDSIVKEANFVVERLPPYYSNLNPVELMWSNVM